MSSETLKSPRATEKAGHVLLVPTQDEISTLKAPKYTDATKTGNQEGIAHNRSSGTLQATETEMGAKDVIMIPEASEATEARKVTPIRPSKRQATKFISTHKASPRKTPYSKLRPSAHLVLRPTPHLFPYITPLHLLSPALIAYPSFPHHLHKHTYTTYQLQYRFLPTTLPLPFSFHVFLGPLPASKDWFNATVRVGGHGIAAGHTGKNAISGRVPLTRLLLDRLGGLDEEAVLPYLKKELKWIFERDNGEGAPVELGELKGVRVRVASAQINISEVKGPEWIFYESAVGGTKGRLKEE